MRRTVLSTFLFVAFLGLGCMGVAVPSMAKDSSKPIVIPSHNWSSQVVMAYVIGGIFKHMGNNVKYVSADSQAVYEAIRIGEVTLSHEVWQFAFSKSFQSARVGFWHSSSIKRRRARVRLCLGFERCVSKP